MCSSLKDSVYFSEKAKGATQNLSESGSQDMTLLL